jgi:hypothetical protein
MESFAVFLGILLVGSILYFLFTDPVSFLLFGILIAILFFVLTQFGFVSATTTPDELDITYRPTPTPTGSVTTANGTPQTSAEARLPEVFYVSNNIFSYDQAPSVCKAYGGELATYSQVEDAYNRGAEWCGYGWTSGGMALFPTQEETWRKLQLEVQPSKRTACGRPGINGGYFDPLTKFGVNCYGIRPKHKKGADMEDKAFAASVARVKGMLGKFSVYPFNKKEWSEYTNVSEGIVSAETELKALGSSLGQGFRSVEGEIGSAAGSVGRGVGSGLRDVGEGVEYTVKGVAGGVQSGAGGIESGVSMASTDVMRGISTFGTEVSDGVNNAISSLGESVSAIFS